MSELSSRDVREGDAHSCLSSFDKLDRYLDTQNALSFAASQPIMQSNGMNVMMDALEGSETNLKKAGLKRKGSEKGTRAAEVSRSAVKGLGAVTESSDFSVTEKSEYEQDA
jgi:hypothetical protein